MEERWAQKISEDLFELFEFAVIQPKIHFPSQGPLAQGPRTCGPRTRRWLAKLAAYSNVTQPSSSHCANNTR